MRFPFPSRVLLLSACVAACSHAEDAEMGEALPTWTLERELRIGAVDDPDYVFSAARGLEIGPDGEIYTLHPQDAEIRRWTSDGRPNGRIGRRGEGPGEFERLDDFGWAGDTLWVWDDGSFRLTWFDQDGALVRDQAVNVAIGSRELAARSIYPPRQETLLPDGTMYGRTPAFSNDVVAGTLTEIAHVRISVDGELLDTLVVLPIGKADVLGILREDGGGTYTSQPFGDGAITGLTYDRRSFLVLDRTAAKDPEGRPEYRLTKIDSTGDTVFSRGYRYVPIPIPEATVDSAVNATAQGLFDFVGARTGRPLPQWQDDVRSALWVPDHYPPVEEIRPGRDGKIWVQLTTPGRDDTLWEVLGESGDPVGRVETPAAFTLLAAGADGIWGVERDELDVEYIVKYRLVIPS